MSATHKAPVNFPHAIIRRRAVLSLIWLVPVLAGVVDGVLVWQNLERSGPLIHIEFQSATGLDANQTVVRYRGVRVGKVRTVELTRDLRGVEVTARLERFASGLARQGSIFWIVRPEVGAAGVHALETIVSGPYIEGLPGDAHGQAQTHFVGEEEAPVIKEGSGTEFILQASAIRSLGANSPVYFRGLQAGKVQYLELSADSTAVNVHVWIKPSFAPLVRSNTVWWNAGGINVNWHLLSGLNMSAENLRAVVTGGISFATPSAADSQASPGSHFTLYDKPEIKWLDWSPQINITNAAVSTPGNPAAIDLDNLNQPPKQ